MCRACHGPFDFRSYGRTDAESRREIATCAELLLQSCASDRLRRIAAGDVVAAEAEAFLQKWLGTSEHSWDRVIEGSSGYSAYVHAMTRAAELGSADAMIDLARYGRVEARRPWMVRAAAAGKPQARMWISAAAADSHYHYAALTWARLAAEAGCEKSMVMFGFLVLDIVRRGDIGGEAMDGLRAEAEAHLAAALERADPLAGFVLLELLSERGEEVPDDIAALAGQPWPDDDPRLMRRRFSWFDLLA